MTIEDAFNHLKQAIQKDAEYAWGWHCNLAVPMQDEGMSWEGSQRAAAIIMHNLFGVQAKEPLDSPKSYATEIN